jgi:hypothetical protein
MNTQPLADASVAPAATRMARLHRPRLAAPAERGR